ncbi:unnamed protein product [Staurois parvus]|uniref:Uncharacterized protein n=1 Tax=Staurois parvus TaxID=386267 RepID=A0ABN9G994_9NEOB|nr:unnamed protein product [Staurois parvus]
MQAGRRTKHSGQNVCEMSLLQLSNFPPVPSPVRPDVAGNGTRKTDVGIGQRRWPGTLQGGHRGSAGQGKCWRDPRAALQWYSRV